jgi:prephenate dehydrogenase
MSGDDAPFETIAIVGLGLIGGSIALAVREQWPSVRVVAVDRPAVLAHAAGSGAIDRAAASVAEIGHADLLVLAAPVRQNVQLLAQAWPHFDGSTVITDVGGTKRDIVEAATGHAEKRSAFLGGHPIGGAEHGGFGFARPDLFRGKPWIFTPDASTPADVLNRLSGFVRGLGARPTTMDAAEHDRLMAFVSHLPQLTASALMQVVGQAATSDGLRLAGRGLTDTTRLASSPVSSWRDVCATNADALRDALDALIASLSRLRADLEGGAAVQEMFDEAAHWRAELLKNRE